MNSLKPGKGAVKLGNSAIRSNSNVTWAAESDQQDSIRARSHARVTCKYKGNTLYFSSNGSTFDEPRYAWPLLIGEYARVVAISLLAQMQLLSARIAPAGVHQSYGSQHKLAGRLGKGYPVM